MPSQGTSGEGRAPSGMATATDITWGGGLKTRRQGIQLNVCILAC